MTKKIICSIAVSLLLTSCAVTQQQKSDYPRKPNTSSGRKAGPAMSLYEQAEKDMDLTNDVIVIPPAEVEKKKTIPGTEQ
ncbi:MAG: hypothetical protein WBB19_02460 [Desulforhopalus sp.]